MMKLSNPILRTAFRLTLAAAAAIAVVGGSAHAQRESSQSLIETGFVLKIPLFIEWPKLTAFSGSSVIRIAILGDEAMAKHAKIVLANSSTGGRITEAEHIPDPAHISQFQEVFIGDEYCSKLSAVLPVLREIPTVTISRCENFIQEGGMFRLYRDGAHVRIEMNKEALELAGLSADYRLAAMAKQYRREK